MKILLCFTIVIAIALTQAAVPAPRIVGGQNAILGQFPHQVAILYNYKHRCGGSIINKRWILTSASCLVDVATDELQILAGTTTLNQGGTVYNVQEGRVHSGWNPMTIQHNIAVLQTSRDIVFSNAVRTIPLNTEDIAPGSILELSGWGYTSYPEIKEPNDLQYLNMPYITLDECKQQADPIYDTQLCTLSPAGQGSCKGDSGGPLVYRQKLVGVVSWGRPCALGRPDVYTNVAKYLEWILETIIE